jgi:ribosomal protein S18 acetylase RimI-like enzyme
LSKADLHPVHIGVGGEGGAGAEVQFEGQGMDTVEWKDGAPIVEKLYDRLDEANKSKLKQLALRGYKVKYGVERTPLGQDLYVQVFHDDKQIARAEFTRDPDEAHCENAWVEPSYQRQWIANLMYVIAEEVLGIHLSNFWNGDPKQSAKAKALWAQPNRPFGYPRRKT